MLVRVVVRDDNGRTVGNLHKEDFRLFDDGKPQEIADFSVEVSNPKPQVPQPQLRPPPRPQPPLRRPLSFPSDS